MVSEGPTSDNDFPNLMDRLVEHALDNWCVPPVVVPDPDPDYPMDVDWGRPEVRAEISDLQLKALYQLHYLWAKEEGRSIDDPAWARHYAGLISTGGLIPLVAWGGGMPVGCADVTLFQDPFTCKGVGYADHAWVYPSFRGAGVFAKIMSGCVNLGRLMGIDRAIIPSRPDLVPAYQRAAEKHGWEEHHRYITLVLEPKE